MIELFLSGKQLTQMSKEELREKVLKDVVLAAIDHWAALENLTDLLEIELRDSARQVNELVEAAEPDDSLEILAAEIKRWWDSYEAYNGIQTTRAQTQQLFLLSVLRTLNKR
jgi:hypothetical protein